MSEGDVASAAFRWLVAEWAPLLSLYFVFAIGVVLNN